MTIWPWWHNGKQKHIFGTSHYTSIALHAFYKNNHVFIIFTCLLRILWNVYSINCRFSWKYKLHWWTKTIWLCCKMQRNEVLWWELQSNWIYSSYYKMFFYVYARMQKDKQLDIRIANIFFHRIKYQNFVHVWNTN